MGEKVSISFLFFCLCLCFNIGFVKAQSLRLNVDGLYSAPFGGVSTGSYDEPSQFGFAGNGGGLRLGVSFLDEDYASGDFSSGVYFNFNATFYSVNQNKIKSVLFNSSPDTSSVRLRYTPFNFYYANIGLPLNWSWEVLEIEVPLGVTVGYCQGSTVKYYESEQLRYQITKNSGGIIGVNAGVGVGVPLFDNRLVLRGGLDINCGAILLTQDILDNAKRVDSSGESNAMLYGTFNVSIGIAYVIEY